MNTTDELTTKAAIDGKPDVVRIREFVELELNRVREFHCKYNDLSDTIDAYKKVLKFIEEL